MQIILLSVIGLILLIASMAIYDQKTKFLKEAIKLKKELKKANDTLNNILNHLNQKNNVSN